MSSAIYWKDLERPGDAAWGGLALRVDGLTPQPAAMRLLSGHNGRVQFVAGGQTLFWATLARDYGGVWLIRTLAELPPEQMPIAPIHSQQVQACAELRGDDWFKAWSRFFAIELSQRPGSFLHDGLWLLQGVQTETTMPPAPPDKLDDETTRAIVAHWRWRTLGAGNARLPEWSFCSFADDLTAAPVHWIDWWGGGDGLLPLREVRDDDGRVKWWRKQAREGCLPPVLVLFLSCLSSGVIIDGHCRLRAALLEGVAPDIIVISSTQSVEVTPNPAEQERLFHSLEKARQRQGALFPVEKLNEILIRVFDDRPLLKITTRAHARLAEARWLDEVRAYLERIGRGEDFAAIEAREG